MTLKRTFENIKKYSLLHNDFLIWSDSYEKSRKIVKTLQQLGFKNPNFYEGTEIECYYGIESKKIIFKNFIRIMNLKSSGFHKVIDYDVFEKNFIKSL